jgi:hypothetical protein
MRKLIYIAGPMTGLPLWNKPAFHEAECRLIIQGHEVVNPANIFDHTDRAWEFYMKAALRAMLICDGVYMLEGWKTSRGAGIEEGLARLLKMPITYQTTATTTTEKESPNEQNT